MCDKKRKVSLIGIGTGGVKEMTERAKEEILASDCLIGASRMLESAACFLEQKKDRTTCGPTTPRRTSTSPWSPPARTTPVTTTSTPCA